MSDGSFKRIYSHTLSGGNDLRAGQKFRVWAEKQDHIQQVYYVTGAVDLIAIVTARDVEHYDDIAALIMADNPQIRRMHTNVVLRDVKLGLFVPLE